MASLCAGVFISTVCKESHNESHKVRLEAKGSMMRSDVQYYVVRSTILPVPRMMMNLFS